MKQNWFLLISSILATSPFHVHIVLSSSLSPTILQQQRPQYQQLQPHEETSGQAEETVKKEDETKDHLPLNTVNLEQMNQKKKDEQDKDGDEHENIITTPRTVTVLSQREGTIIKEEEETHTNQQCFSSNTEQETVTKKEEEFVSLQQNLATCLAHSHEQMTQLATWVMQTQELQQKLTLLELNLFSTQSNYDILVKAWDECKNQREILQQQNQETLTQLQDIQDRYESKVSNFQKEQKEWASKVMQLETRYKHTSHEYYDARDEIIRLEKELRKMYDDSQSIYINTALIQKDLGWVLMTYIDQLVDMIETILHSKVVRDVQKTVKDTIMPWQRKLLYYYKLYHVEEHIHALGKHWNHGKKVKHNLQLTLASWLQHGCKIALNYMDIIATSPSREQRKRSWYTVSFDTKSRRRSKTRLRVNQLVKNWMEYAEMNSEQVIECGLWTMIAVIVTMLVLGLVWITSAYVLSHLFCFMFGGGGGGGQSSINNKKKNQIAGVNKANKRD